MAHRLQYFLAVLFMIATHSQSHCLEYEDELTIVTTASPLPCPDPDDIVPCVCYVDQHFNMEMDCSSVTSNEQLWSVFNQPLPFPRFHQLTIESNKKNLTTLLAGCFGESSFVAINIVDCLINVVEPNALSGSASTLQELTISSTELTVFPFEELQMCEVLNNLELSHNKFTDFPTIESSSIEKLIVDGNDIDELQQISFDGLPNLKYFTCGGCDISDVLSGTFSETIVIDYISLEGNKLISLAKDSFELHGEASSLILSHNNISSVDVNAIRGVTFRVDLNNNQLAELPEEVWKPVFDSALIFSAADNPILCSCDIAWIILNPDYMAKLYGDEKCSNGQFLKDLDPELYREMCT